MTLSAANSASKPVNEAWLSQSASEALHTQRILISIVGLTALLLPPALVGADVAFAPSCLRDSLSHYYYSRPAGDIFVMTLAFIGTLLVAYRGETRGISRWAGVAGIAAICVGLFPTTGTGCEAGAFDGRIFADVAQDLPRIAVQPFSLFAQVENLHYGAAALLFGLMFWFCWFIFTKVGARDRDPVSGDTLPIKTRRNMIYYGCAAVIALSIVALGFDYLLAFSFAEGINLTLICEWSALWALGVAWLVKGRIFNIQAMGA